MMNSYKRKAKVLADSYKRIEVEINAAKTRLKYSRKFLAQKDYVELKILILNPLLELKESLEIAIINSLKTWQVFDSFLMNFIGDGDVGLLLNILLEIDNIKRFETVSSLWKFSGYSPMKFCLICQNRVYSDGEWSVVQGKHKGYESEVRCTCVEPQIQLIGNQNFHHSSDWDSNLNLKKSVDKYVNQLIDNNVFYNSLYEHYMKKESQKNISDKHKQNRAKRKVKKAFLYHLMNEWRLSDGLDKIEPYKNIVEYGSVL